MSARLCDCAICGEPCVFDEDPYAPDLWVCRGCGHPQEGVNMVDWSEWEEESEASS